MGISMNKNLQIIFTNYLDQLIHFIIVSRWVFVFFISRHPIEARGSKAFKIFN